MVIESHIKFCCSHHRKDKGKREEVGKKGKERGKIERRRAKVRKK